MTKKVHSIIVPLFIVFRLISVSAQTNEERRERADKFFEKENYVQATPDYLHLLSLDPRSADLNFRYGACLLFNSNQKSESLRYLKFATSDPNIDSRAYYFYGLALHLNYQFGEAQRFYGTYANLTIGKSDPRYPVDRQIEMCNNGKRLLTTFTDIIVAEKQEIDNSKFFRIYTDANTIGGDILVTAKFQSRYDVKMGHVPIVHFPPNAKEIYYSSYGDNGANGLDIYVRRKLPNGEWGEPQSLPGMVNTKFDEDFPYMHPSGKYLYFSSTGHNSMGGYDVYLSKLDVNTNTFREPENVDFAISSPDDDFFYVVDSAFQNAYFASARQSQDGMLHVYKVKVARVPLKEVIIMGEFISEVNPELKSMSIKLTYNTNGNDVGLVKSNKIGKYSYVFPQGGKYNYAIDIEGISEEFTFTVELPFLDELRPLKQRIIHTKEDGQDIVKILNLFDEDVEGAEAIIADVIRKKSELNVNIQEFDLDALDQEAKNQEILAELGFENMSPSEISTKIKELVDINENKKEVQAGVSDNIDSEILAKSERIQDLNEIQQELTEKALKTDDPITKHRLLSEAQQKEAQKENLIDAIESLVALKEEVKSKLSSSSSPNAVNELKDLSSRYDALLNQDKENEAITLLAEEKLLLRTAGDGTPDELMNDYIKKSSDLREQIRNESKKEQQINALVEASNQEVNRLQGLIEVSKKKDIPAIEKQIADKREEISMAQQDLQKSRERKVELTRELGIVDAQIASLQNAMTAEEHIAVNQSVLTESIKSVETIAEVQNTVNYAEEIAKIEERSPALFNTNASVQEKVKTKLASDIAATQKESGLSPAEKLAQEERLLEAANEQLESRKEVIQQEMTTNPSNELKEELSRIENYQTEIHAEKVRVAAELEAMRSDNPDLAYSKSDVQKELAPSLESDIKNNEASSRTELEKSRELVKLLNEFDNKLQEEKTALQSEYDRNPEKSELEGRIALVDELIQDNEKRLNTANQRLSNAEADVAVQEANPSDLISDFVSQLTNAQNQVDPIRSLEEEKVLQNKVLSAVDERVKELDKNLKKNPNDEASAREKESLEMLKTTTANRITAIDEAIQTAQNTLVEKETVNKDLLVNNYTSRKAEIEQKGAAGNTEMLALEQELAQQIKNELAKTESALSGNPEDLNLLTKKRDLLLLEEENYQQIKALEAASRTEVKTYESDEALLNELVSAEISKLLSKDENQLNTKEKTNLSEALTEAQAKLDELKNELTNSSLSEDQKDEQIKRIARVEAELNQKKKTLEGNTELEFVATSLVADYDSRKESIENNTEITETQRLEQLVKLDEELKAAAQKDLEATNKKLKRDSENNEFIARKASLQDELLASEARIAENRQTLELLTTSTTNTPNLDGTSVRNEVLFDFDSRKESIENNPELTETQRLEQLLQLDEELIAALQKDLEATDKKLKRDAENPALLSRKELLQAELLSGEGRISENKQTLELLAGSNTIAQTFDEAKVIDELMPNYESRRSSIGAGAFNEQMEFEQELLEALRAKVVSLEKNDPANQLPEYKTLLTKQEAVLEEIRETSFNALSEEEKLSRIKSLSSNYSSDEALSKEEKIEQELQLQEVLDKEIQSLEKQLARKGSAGVDLALYQTKRLLAESERREADLKKENPVDAAKNDFIQELRATYDFSEKDESELTPSELKSYESELVAYESALYEEKQGLEAKIQNNPEEGDAERLNWLNEELEEVAASKHRAVIRMGELETLAETNDSNELSKLNIEINETKNKLESATNDSERRILENELRALEQERTKLENEVKSNEIRENQTINNALISKVLAENSNTDKEKLGAYHTSNQELEDKRLTEIEAIDNPKHKAYELEKLQADQNQKQVFVNEIALSDRVEQIEMEAGVNLSSREELEARKRRFVIRVGEIDRETEQLREELNTAKKTEKDGITQEIEALESEKALLQSEIARLETRILEAPSSQEVSEELSLKTDISFSEEREIAAREDYKVYEEKASLAVRKAKQIKSNEMELNILRDQLKEKLLNELAGANQDEEIEVLTRKIATLEEETDRLRIELIQEEYQADKMLPTNEEDAMKFKNLIRRGVKPIQASVVAASILSIPAEGFAIGEKAEPGTPREIPIAVGVKAPEGLVYRVQVGAFARPIPAEHFSEFTPVSGEKIEGTNITRYMAGYFNSSSRVTEAREEIRRLGYSDAFIVAYCNGERIQFGEAKRLEAAGICVPKRENELMLQVAQNTAENLGVDLSAASAKVEENDYNKAPGAAPADPIEEMPGLFFTVQIGVFNQPVGKESLYGMDEILTFRLPNGQIRYSSGIFNSVNEAKPRRTEALNNGVQGAFITAYLNGERIPLWEANRILDEQGSAILYTKQAKPKVEEPKVTPIDKNPVVLEEVRPEKVDQAPARVQIVSKKRFEDFPRDVLNRYNTEGTFFFDETDRRVKSVIYQDEDHLPRLFNFRNDIDTIYLDQVQLMEASQQLTTAVVRIETDKMPGDLMDWLLRSNLRRSIEQKKDGIVLKLYDIREEKRMEITQKLQTLGYVPELVEQETMDE